MPAVLITQCIQRDFVAPLDAHEPMPNALHVGAEEARRLLGEDPEHGPLAHLMTWARREASKGLHIVHVRDAHDPEDPNQAAHLALFGRHCVRGTRGAELVLGLEESLGANEEMVDAIGLNDCAETRLPEVLGRIRDEDPSSPLRVGVIGVWTDAKVTFLAYDLKTRLGIEQVATCSALTASSSRAAHFAALDQLKRLLSLTVHDSVGDFAAWLVPDGGEVAPSPLPASSLPLLECEPKERAPHGADADLIGYLHRNAARVRLEPLSGGFSGAGVYRAEAFDALGHAHAPSVVKIGARDLIAKERVAFEQVEAILGNHAPTLRGYADLGDRAALRFAFASMGSGKVKTFKSLVEGDAPLSQIGDVLDEVFERVLGRFQAAAQYERLPLLSYYQFASRWASNVRTRAAAIAGVDPSVDALPVAGTVRQTPARFYEALDSFPAPHGESHFVAWVHGDLNGANILVDRRENVWVIDYFHAHRGHVLRDLAKLENDVLYLMTPIPDEATLAEHVHVTDALRSVSDLREPLPESIEGVRSPSVTRAYAIVRRLRALVAEFARSDRDPHQLRVPLLRYAVHTLSFDEADSFQKRAALAASCGLAGDVRNGLERSRALRLDEVPRGARPGRLFVTLCPGRRDRERVLDEDVATLRACDVAMFVTFVTDDELAWAGVPQLPESVRSAGIEVLRLPMPDQRVPTLPEAHVVVERARASLDRGHDVVFACMGGLGRSGMMAACALVAEGQSPDDAIAAVRSARGPRAVETRLQEDFVRAFAVNS